MEERIIERTLVLIKPDGVKRGLTGEVLQRFEQAGFKIVGMKMVNPNEELASEHYGEDIEKRRGKHVRDKLMDMLKRGPVVAFVLEGFHAIEIIRKIVGDTEPRKAMPGTIRGDYSYSSYESADAKGHAVLNIIHASSSHEDAQKEIKLWFKPEELYSYKNMHELMMEEF